MIILFSFFPRQRVSSVLTLVVIISILLQAAGCVPGPTEPLPDPNIVAISQLIENMPDEAAPDMAEIFKAGLEYLRDSTLLMACLPESQLSGLPRIIGDAQNLDWSKVNSVDLLEKTLLSGEMSAVFSLLDSAANKCDGPDGGTGEAGGFGRNLIAEVLHIDNDYINFSNPKVEFEQELNTYLTCMADTDRFLRDSCGPMAADEAGHEGSPNRGDEELPEITLDEDGVVIWDEADDNPDHGLPLDRSDDTNIDGNEVGGKGREESDIDDEKTYWNTTFKENVNSHPVQTTVVGLFFATAAFAICTSATAGICGVIVAGGTALWATTAHTATFIEDCAAPYEDRLLSEHPLQGANYQLGGVPLGTGELYNACTCLGVNPNDPDPRTWGCKSDAEQRRDCRRNPYGPDDAPRPECVDLLYEDNGIEPPDQCTAAMCPSPYTIVNQEQCTCGLPSPQGEVVLDPNVQDACVQTQCGPDSVPMVVNGACGCVPIGGPGEGPGLPPETPPELP